MIEAASRALLSRLVCVDWYPVVRANRNSTLRGRLAVEFEWGLVLKDISVLSTGRRHWVQIPGRLRLDPHTNRPVTGPYCWDPIIEFRDTDASRRFSAEAIAALLRTYPDALDP